VSATSLNRLSPKIETSTVNAVFVLQVAIWGQAMSNIKPDSEETAGLVEQAGAGDRVAFERLFERHRAELLRVVAARLDQNARARLDPSDVVQEAQLEAFRRLPDYLSTRSMPFRLWLRKTAHERLLMARRQHVVTQRRSVQREVPLPEGSAQLGRPFLDRGSSPSQKAVKLESAQMIRLVLESLPEADRELLLLRTYERLSNQEAAYILDVDPASASKRYGRAVLRLHRLLLEVGLGESRL
jgi:RNA polymerase sigma-70 factor (ECF subfamily)